MNFWELLCFAQARGCDRFGLCKEHINQLWCLPYMQHWRGLSPTRVFLVTPKFTSQELVKWMDQDYSSYAKINVTYDVFFLCARNYWQCIFFSRCSAFSTFLQFTNRSHVSFVFRFFSNRLHPKNPSPVTSSGNFWKWFLLWYLTFYLKLMRLQCALMNAVVFHMNLECP